MMDGMNVRDSAKVVAATTEIEILINYNSQSFPRRGITRKRERYCKLDS